MLTASHPNNTCDALFSCHLPTGASYYSAPVGADQPSDTIHIYRGLNSLKPCTVEQGEKRTVVS